MDLPSRPSASGTAASTAASMQSIASRRRSRLSSWSEPTPCAPEGANRARRIVMRRDALAPLPARPTTPHDTAADRRHLIGILKLAQAAGDTFHIPGDAPRPEEL